ncbi:ATP-dependent DNA helicase [Corynebacterium sp. HS2168-gen11]|uniref:ATP-dependent DNA helicase n=1 Tax=Corynebacterium sp. HS2168-gen11 TaxID=2974027 RepID=UPI00216B25B0|nr:ATP-dependent DNA helicase [Corynebacterium sp. HS2168-gen11]MCS4535823.1 ATP-dependent helicase [Corynebacterium sp. HS2168-gen11]
MHLPPHTDAPPSGAVTTVTNTADTAGNDHRVKLIPPVPTVRLYREQHNIPEHQWDNDLYRLRTGHWKLTGEAGTGVSSLLIDTAIACLDDGVLPDEIMIIAPSKSSASRLHAQLVQRLGTRHYGAAQTTVRSVHSAAFELLRKFEGDSLRLLTGAEQDAIMGEMLRNESKIRQVSHWPAEIRNAVPLKGFALAVRDFLLRAVERGCDAAQLKAIGEQFDRPIWSSAAAFLTEYRQVMALSGAHVVSAAELMHKVLAHDLSSTGVKVLLVDDAQHLDPQSAAFLQELRLHTQFSVIAGNLEHSIYHFRGARPEFLQDYQPEHQLHLTQSFRKPTSTTITTFSREQDLAVGVADALRRAHLEQSLPWNQMAVLVRHTGQREEIRRALLAAGVPVTTETTARVLQNNHLVEALITAIESARHGGSISQFEALCISPIGGADPVILRRLLRGLRLAELRRVRAHGDDTSDAPLRVALEVLASYAREATIDSELQALLEETISEREYQILERIRAVIQAAQIEGSVEEILWNTWDVTGLGNHLLAVSLRGGSAGSQADHDLDAMMALFDAAGDYAERQPHAGIDAFIEHIRAQEIATNVRDRRLVAPDAVTLITAHSASGLQWDTVIVAGAQEGLWPDFRETGDLFQQEELLEYLDEQIPPGTPVSRNHERLAEERRLFRMCCSRATGSLSVMVVSAPDSDEAIEPSRFVHELQVAITQAEPEVEEARFDGTVETPSLRLLAPETIIAELRRVVQDPTQDATTQEQAARQLARLANAGVPGAHVEQWWGYGGVSTEEPLQVRALSPSKINQALQCPLHAVLGQAFEEFEASDTLLRGSLLHAAAEAYGNGADPEVVRLLVAHTYQRLFNNPAWQQDAKFQEFMQTLEQLEQWVKERESFDAVAKNEIMLDVSISEKVHIQGRIDRLEQNSNGSCLIIDFKTGKSAITAPKAEEHKQLLAYQLALHHGQMREHEIVTGEGLKVEAAELVYPEILVYRAVKVLKQNAKTPAELAEFAESLEQLYEDLTGPTLRTQRSELCDHCTLTHVCPTQQGLRLTPLPTTEEQL